MRLLFVFCVSFSIVSCAHRGVNNQEDASPFAYKSRSGIWNESSLDQSESSPGPEMFVKGMRLEHTNFDIPVEINDSVLKWVDYFTGKGRVHFEKYLERSEYFIPYIQTLLHEHGMPQDLVYLSLIESGFHNHARSWATAVGPWQFMSYTGKRYGLNVNWWVDERRDIEKSTIAAIRYLKDLYTLFGDWRLAMAGYNAGESKIRRALKRTGNKDFWALMKIRYLKPETKNYVPKLMAAAILVKNRTQFGFPNAYIKEPLENETIAPDGQIVKVETSVEEDDVVPPSLTQTETMEDLIMEVDNTASIDTEANTLESGDPNEEEIIEAAVLYTRLETVEESNERSPPQVLAKPIPTPHVNKKGEISQDKLVEFEVQSPADLLKVAQAAGLSYQTVKGLNPEIQRWCTPPHVNTYRIKLPESVQERFLTHYNSPNFERAVRFRVYKVRRGDNLKRVAKRFGIKEDPIVDLNSLKGVTRGLKAGTELILPIPTDPSRSLASLDLYDPPTRKRRYRRARAYYRKKYKHRVNYQQRRSARATASK